MVCSTIKLPDGTVAIVRHSPRRFPPCKFCLTRRYGRQHQATQLCDFEIARTLGGEPITCDANICTHCAQRVGDKDFCPKHRKK